MLSSYIYYQKYLFCLGILLCNDLLIKNGCFIQHSFTPNKNYEYLLKILNIQYNQFNYHEFGDTHYFFFDLNIPVTYIFYGYNNILDKDIYHNLKISLKKKIS